MSLTIKHVTHPLTKTEIKQAIYQSFIPMIDLLSPPVKRADVPYFNYPRSPAYERAVKAILPEGWVTYSEIDGTAYDFGVTRKDGRAHIFGCRQSDQAPSYFRAVIPGRVTGDHSIDQAFSLTDLPAALLWCEGQIKRFENSGLSLDEPFIGPQLPPPPRRIIQTPEGLTIEGDRVPGGTMRIRNASGLTEVVFDENGHPIITREIDLTP